MTTATRRALMAAAAGAVSAAFAPRGLRISSAGRDPRYLLWSRDGGPRLRGAVFVQRRVYPELDGPSFLGPGPVGAPITDEALDRLAEAGANLASWSGPGPFAEQAPFHVDAAIEDHIAAWLDRCAARGLYTTLCLRSGPGRSAFAFHPGESWYPADLYDASLWFDPEKQAAWAQMADWTLHRFSTHPALAGVLAMDEPNAADFDRASVWSGMAAQIAQTHAGQAGQAPLLLSPDRWARLEAAPALRRAAGTGPVLITHDYSPWDYTHPEQPGAAFIPDQAGPAPGRDLGPAGVLEFGAPRGAPDLSGYLEHRISAYEAAGLNWAAFRWTSGWSVYEQAEGARALSEDRVALSVLERAFAANTVRP